ncbi:cell division protein FtsQ/DivIB [Nitrospira lenta]|uniref:Putative Cell division protein FtsQ n=1 Tax=Nitrospira lenta TaxID=1436998 RepID=A0A330L1L0_9BACT|nr:FtsQ-type POTRA domain-containing protein [Nitrospira lenta]SPP63610.1 putative Cell division protein FtsQ [Nitrospira lenta]
MKRWTIDRRRAQRSSGPRLNQWKGTRSSAETTQDRAVRRTQAAAKGRRLIRWSAIVVGVVLAGWGLAVGIQRSGPLLQRLLEIKAVTVEGVHQIGKQELVDRLALKPGTSLHHILTTTMKERVESHPWVKEAVITRVPLHELRISVVERKPAAIVHAGSENFLSDEEGHVLARLGQDDNGMLPMVTGLDSRELLRGDTAVRHAVKSGVMLSRLVGQSIDGRVQVNAANPANLVATVRGVQFQFGEAEVSDQWERFQRVKPSLKTVMFDGHGRGGNEIDLRYENRVIVRERG